jgi:anti-sigma regulatory factor (Ser/Thr protein kinase)/anti-anti-sigma regulatory factor
MPVPILKQGNVLIVSVQAALTDRDLVQLRDDLADRVGRLRSRGVIIDVSLLDVMDSFATRTFRGIAQTTKLRGAKTVIVGIHPDVAFAMVQLGLTLDGVATALDLEEGLQLLTVRGEGTTAVTHDEIHVVIGQDGDVVTARQKGRELAIQVGFSGTDLTIIATAISEIARNIVTYAQHGEIILSPVLQGGRRGILVIGRDHGPGIPDIGLAMRDGFSTGRSLGLGLPGARRLMDEFEIVSEVGKGTTVTMKKWTR